MPAIAHFVPAPFSLYEFDGAEARFLAAHVALGGTALPLTHRPESAAATFREMANLRDVEGLWFEIPGLLSNAELAQAAVGDGFGIA